MIDIPSSMQTELSSWNNGAGIDLRSWVGCSGNFSLAIGYAAVFWPEFVLFEGYILRRGFSEVALRRWEGQEDSTRKSVEWVTNHLHVADIQYWGCPDITRDKILMPGNALRELTHPLISSPVVTGEPARSAPAYRRTAGSVAPACALAYLGSAHRACIPGGTASASGSWRCWT